MPFVDKYIIQYSPEFTITGRQEVTEDLQLTTNPAAISGTITGTVTDPTGAEVAGATVKLFDSTNAPVEHTITDANGVYTFQNVPAGSYNVAATATGFLLSNFVPASIQNNGQTATADITLIANDNAGLSTVYGLVTSSTGNTPIENATVTLTVAGQTTTVGTVTTNDRGQFLFANLDAGSYVVSASKPGFTSNQTGTLTVGTNAIVNGDVALTPNAATNNGTVSGVITDTSTGLPIVGATVALYTVTGGTERVIAVTQTNSAGRYLFANLTPATTYRVKATQQV